MAILVRFIIAIFLLVGSDVDAGHCELSDKCAPSQPDIMNQISDYKGSGRICLLRYLSSNCELVSNISVVEKESVPNSQGWSLCNHCVYANNTILAYGMQISATATVKIALSWSQWGEFFFTNQNDKYFAEVLESSTSGVYGPSDRVYYIDRPVFILPMITIHVGHIIIDLLEQVYDAMLLHYGRVRRDALLVLDVAGMDERAVLQQKIFVNAFSDDHDTFASVIRLLTDLPVLTKADFLESMSARGEVIIFKALHIGLDISESFFNKGFEYHPCIMSGSKSRRLSKKYRRFKQFVWGDEEAPEDGGNSVKLRFQDNLMPESHLADSNRLLRVLLIQRKENRKITNIDAVVEVLYAQNISFVIAICDLVDLSFTEQVRQFSSADILIATAGTALHNILFMHPGSVVITLMQRGWCDWSWMYANQAVLLGILPFILCEESDQRQLDSVESYSQDISSVGEEHTVYKEVLFLNTTLHILEGVNAFHWANNFVAQGPRMTKSDDVFVDVASFSDMLNDATKYLLQVYSKRVEAKANNRKFDFFSETDINGWMDGDAPRCMTDRSRYYFNRRPYDVSSPAEAEFSRDDSSSRSQTEKPPVFFSAVEESLRYGALSSSRRMTKDVVAKQAYIHPRFLSTQVRVIDSHMYDRDTRERFRLPLQYSDLVEGSFIATLEVYVSSVKAVVYDNGEFKNLLHKKEWKVSIMGEVVSRDPTIDIVELYKSIPHLAVCFQSLFTDSSPVCVPTNAFNYYADLNAVINQPVHHVHMWAQTLTSGGKITGSDTFVTLDIRLGQNGGLFVHSELASVARKIGTPYVLDLEVVVEDEEALFLTSSMGTVIRSTRKLDPKTFSVHLQIKTKYCLQRLTADFCRLNNLTRVGCLKVSAEISRYAYKLLLARKEGLPAVQTLPNPTNPFVFIHIEKTAGTTLREIIVESAEREGLAYFVPCHGGIDCLTFSLPQPGSVDLANVSVIAGHFAWGVWNQLPKPPTKHMQHTHTMDDHSEHMQHTHTMDDHRQHTHTMDDRSAKGSYSPIFDSFFLPSRPKSPPCLIIGRNPVDRFASYYYQRVFPYTGERINDHTPRSIADVMVFHRGTVSSDNITFVVSDDGMSDSACRTLSNKRATTGHVVNDDDTVASPPLIEEDWDAAMSNIEQCIVGVVERWDDTVAVIKHWFPWINDHEFGFRRRLFSLHNLTEEGRHNIRDDLIAEIYAWNKCDSLLNEKMHKLLDEELAVAIAHSSSSLEDKQAAAKAAGLPEIQVKPTPAKPFVFLHIEKAAGSTLRDIIVDSAVRENVEFFVPCYHDVDCSTFSLTTAAPGRTAPEPQKLANLSVVAGHFAWGEWDKLPNFKKRDKEFGFEPELERETASFLPPVSRKTPPCLVMGRDPVDRVISYYYQRFYDEDKSKGGNSRRLNDLSAEELSSLLISARQGKLKPPDNVTVVIVDDGMSDSACRTLADARVTTGVIVGETDVEIPPPLADDVASIALSNIGECVVGLVERWTDTKLILQHWFPWIKDKTMLRKRFVYGAKKEKPHELRPELIQAILSENQCDFALYEKMKRIFEEQLKVVKSEVFLLLDET